jgi:hypothetical protein
MDLQNNAPCVHVDVFCFGHLVKLRPPLKHM